MTPLMMEIIRHLCATFVVGLAVGWLAKQRYSARTTTQYRTLWEERLQRRKQELDTAQLTVQNYATENSRA